MNVKYYMQQYSTLGPLGYLPASGTWATALALIVILCFPNTSSIEYTSAYLLLFFLAFYSINIILPKNSTEDPSEIVIDEVIGTFVTFSGIHLSPFVLVSGFILFRFFDITKIWPIYVFEKIPRASGILLDDVIAGVLSNLCLRAILWYLRS